MTQKIIISSQEETSIILDGDFNQNLYSKNLEKSLLLALAINTKIP